MNVRGVNRRDYHVRNTGGMNALHKSLLETLVQTVYEIEAASDKDVQLDAATELLEGMGRACKCCPMKSDQRSPVISIG